MSESQRNLGPKVTVITVVLNAIQEIGDTLESIVDQSYFNKELIVIDGGSTDGTIEVIKKFQHKIDLYITERDSGIYDAMNKGIRAASGEWICFMNAGDVFYASDTLDNIFIKTKLEAEILLGDCIVDYKSFTKRVNVKEKKFLKYGMNFCHQSTFVKTELYRKKHFDLRFDVAADFNFFLWCLGSGVNF